MTIAEEKVVKVNPQDKKRTSRAPKHTDIDLVRKQRAKNPMLTVSDQAKLNGVTKQAMSSLLKRHGIASEALTEYKEHRADLLAGVQATILSHLDADRLKKASAKDLTVAYGILYDKERLERGQSTSNQSVFFHIVQESDEAE